MPSPPAPSPTRIALLICGDLTGPALEANGNYLQVYTRFLEDTAPGPFVLTPFYVVTSEVYPDPAMYDALLITGSASSAYDATPWIVSLAAYLARVVVDAPALRIVGICFGHQILARALGGACVPNDGWEVGPTRVQLTPLGARVFGPADGGEEEGEIVIQQMHRDHVPALPPGCVLLGASARAPVQGIVRFYAPEGASPTTTTAATDDTAPLPPIHILAVQGHPEFAESVVAPLVATRAASGAIDGATAAAYEAHGRGVRDDGRGRVARAVWGVMRGEM
ncbi:hypothetical protein HYPSUDRAFT_47688 [Hypholoma sublateritium FD-334 SS-4]|uniref:Uncharacterized protein n=1 Tax=Hypholoma sublateritium (strain FD-334 SS-4) TaxID=945553 RepID=A0A0D2NAJ2_HYPSF|nr:hypothetical protein HYPSUDRAFT_47688 [Hypholoma sublateritium FD-334 SS-4]